MMKWNIWFRLFNLRLNPVVSLTNAFLKGLTVIPTQFLTDQVIVRVATTYTSVRNVYVVLTNFFVGFPKWMGWS